MAGSAPRGLVPRLLLVTSSLLFAVLLGELGLRLLVAGGPAERGPGLEALLERSERSGLGESEPGGRLGLRGLVRASDEPGLVFELKPALNGRFLDRPLAINRFGFRGPELSVDKPTGTFRIAGLGDSVLFGWGVGQGETYLALVENALNARAASGEPVEGQQTEPPRAEVLNFGVPGYNAAMEVALYEARVRAFEPDLLLVHFVANDLRLPHFLSAPPDPWDLGRSYLLDLLAARGELAALRRAELRPHRLAGLPAAERRALKDAHRDGTGEAGFRRVMARLAAQTRQDGVPVVLVRLDRAGRWGHLVREVAEEHGFGQIVLGPRLIAHLADQGLRGRAAHKRAFWIAPDDSHPNALAHRLHAEDLLAWLDASGHLPDWLRPGESAGAGVVDRE